MLEPKRVFAAHLAIIATFALANGLIAIGDAFGRRSFFGFSRLMRLENEANIPSTFSALALAACAVAAVAICTRLQTDDPDRPAWRLLALFFAFLALDEAVMIHEMFNRVGYVLGTGGAVKYVGVFFYLPVVAWLAARLLPFWRRQDLATRAGFVIAGLTYVAGAIGMELAGNGLQSSGRDGYDPLMRASYIFEECGEMVGVAQFLRLFLWRFSLMGGGPLVPLQISDAGGERLPQALPAPADLPDFRTP